MKIETKLIMAIVPLFVIAATCVAFTDDSDALAAEQGSWYVSDGSNGFAESGVRHIIENTERMGLRMSVRTLSDSEVPAIIEKVPLNEIIEIVDYVFDGNVKEFDFEIRDSVKKDLGQDSAALKEWIANRIMPSFEINGFTIESTIQACFAGEYTVYLSIPESADHDAHIIPVVWTILPKDITDKRGITVETVPLTYGQSVSEKNVILHYNYSTYPESPSDLCNPIPYEGENTEYGSYDVEEIAESRTSDSVKVRITGTGNFTGTREVAVEITHAGYIFADSGLRFEIISMETASVSVVSYEGNPVSLTIPAQASFNGIVFSVSSISDKAFCGCKAVGSIDLGSVHSVGTKAFADCPSLKAVIAGGSLESIGEYAFQGCSSLQSVCIPDSVTYIGKSAFGDLAFYGSDGVSVLGSDAESLRGYEYGRIGNKMVRAVGAGDVFSDSGLRYAVISLNPLSVSVIGYEGSPAAVTIPGEVSLNGTAFAVSSVADKAFYGCGTLRSLDLGSVGSVGMKAFARCSSLTSVDASGPLKSLGAYAFYGCNGIEDICFGDGLKSAGYRPFSLSFKDSDGNVLDADAKTLRSNAFISIGGSLVRFAAEVGNSLCLGDLVYRVVDAPALGFSVAGFMYGITDAHIPEAVVCGGYSIDVVSIGENAFYGCSSLVSASIPGSVVGIGENAFYGCSALSRFDGTYGGITDGVMLIADSEILVCATGPDVASLYIPDSVISIRDGAFGTLEFYGSDGAALGTDAEALRGHLYNREGDRMVRAVGVGDVFSDSGLRYSVISLDPLSVSVIGYEGSPLAVAIPGEVPLNGVSFAVSSVADKAFYGCETLRSLDLGSVSSVGMKAFARCSSLAAFDAGDSLESIGVYAFYGCSALEKLDSGACLKSIGSRAFDRCSSLQWTSISGSLESIGSHAFGLPFRDANGDALAMDAEALRGYGYFSDGDAFVRFSIPEGRIIWSGDVKLGVVMSPRPAASVIGYYPGIDEADIPSSVSCDGYDLEVVSIDEKAFMWCDSLRSVSIPGSVKTIGDYAFYLCSSLASVSIPESVESIGHAAFSGCPSLESFSGGYAGIAGGVMLVSGSALVSCAAGPSIVSVTVPDTVTLIDWNSFDGCASLETVHIPGTVASIGDDAFYRCPSLAYVSIPGSVASIGLHAFGSLKFYGIDGETELPVDAETLRGHVYERVGDRMVQAVEAGGVFADSGLEYRILSLDPCSVAVAGYEDGAIDVAVPDEVSFRGAVYSVVSIADKAFYGCKTIESISLGSAVSVGMKAFARCSSLKTVEFGDSVRTVDHYAFYGCTGLSEIHFDGGLRTVKGHAFDGVTFMDGQGILDPVPKNLAGNDFIGSSSVLYLAA